MTEYEKQLESDREEFDSSFIGTIFSILRDGVWHTTSTDGFLRIFESGVIKPSVPSRPFTFPQTQNSFALAEGYVSLFDFGRAKEDDCIFFYSRWSVFFSKHHPFTVAIELDRDALGDSLLPTETAKNRIHYDKMWIPYVEAWHDGPIPLYAAKRYLFIPWGSNKTIIDVKNGTDQLDAMIETVRSAPRVDPDSLYY